MPYYRSNLLVLWLTTFLAAASWTQVVPFLPLFLEELGVRDHLTQWAGLVFSAQFAAGILMAPLWGKIADRRGRKLMAVRAGLCLSAIYFLTALSTAPWHVLVLRFLNGALAGFIPGSMSLVATNTPKHLAARYVASLQTASAAGSIVGPVVGGLLAGWFGIRGALNVSGAAVLVAVSLVIVVVQERNKTMTTQRTTLRQDFGAAFHNPSLLAVMWITLLAVIGSISIHPILAIYVAELSGDTSTVLSGVIFSLPGIALVLTANRWVALGQRIGYVALVRRVLVGAAVMGIALSAARSIYWFGTLFFIQGAFLAALRPVSSAIISEEVEETFRGRAFGMQSSAMTVGGLIGPLLAGTVSGRLGNAAVFWVIGLVLAGGALYLKVQESKERDRSSAPKDVRVPSGPPRPQ